MAPAYYFLFSRPYLNSYPYTCTHPQDPNGLLRGTGTEGITVFVLERGHPGLKLGSRLEHTFPFTFRGCVATVDLL